MQIFTYKAINTTGRAVLGQLEALNIIDLELRLQRMKLELVDGAPINQRSRLLRRKSISRSEIINFCFHLEQLIQAGVPLVESLIDLRNSVENPRFGELLSGVVESIQGGSTLSSALSNYPMIFNPVFCSLIKTGEDTGRLPEVLKNLLETLKWEDELASQVRRLMIYPAFVGAIVLIVVMFLMVYLVPQMVGFIRSMGQALPLHTQILIATSSFFVNYWWTLFIVPPLAFYLFRAIASARPDVRIHIDQLKLDMPLFGPVWKKIILSRFATTFALMYSSGITVLDALRSAEQGAGNTVISEALKQVGQKISEGNNLTRAFQDTGIFPPLIIRMLRVGESTGALDAALTNVSYFYTREVRDSIARIQVLIEPALTVFLGTVLGWVMLSVLGPIYDTVSRVKL